MKIKVQCITLFTIMHHPGPNDCGVDDAYPKYCLREPCEAQSGCKAVSLLDDVLGLCPSQNGMCMLLTP